ncbi:MAG TPA: ribonuclease HII [Spirochaetia bacterium]|nr:ribonuclease HII [Spirochaetia bacterium]
MIICGIDEAGRGPLAGPVTAAAVVLPPGFPLELLDDSKKLSEAQRERALRVILQEALAYSVGWAWPEEIDAINILQASLLAMKRAYELLPLRPDRVFVDGPFCPEIDARVEAIVHGDSLIKEIEAASILAKTARDRWMVRYSWIDDRFGFERHKGYPTAEHRRLCGVHGLSEIHRRSFRIFPSA